MSSTLLAAIAQDAQRIITSRPIHAGHGVRNANHPGTSEYIATEYGNHPLVAVRLDVIQGVQRLDASE